MSTTPPVTPVSMPLITRRVRAYFAPVNRAAAQPTIFDPALSGLFNLNTPPPPWVDLGWVDTFSRQSGTKPVALNAGLPAMAKYQVRESVEATVSFRFKTWSKLSMALASGSQHMNVLIAAAGGTAIGSGSKALPALALGSGSTATMLTGVAPSALQPGSMISVDVDYLGQTGYVGSGVSAAYVRNASDVDSDPDYIRRVSFNVSRIAQVTTAGLQLDQALPAGIPGSDMKVQQILGFVDREGGSFFQEWSALFVLPGEQGERLIFHYPRLQAAEGAKESVLPVLSPLESVYQAGAFRALPVVDINDGEQVLCFRTYLPAAATTI